MIAKRLTDLNRKSDQTCRGFDDGSLAVWRDRYWDAVDGQKDVTYLDAISLPKHHCQTLLFHAQFDVQGVAESLLSLYHGEVVVIVEDHPSRLGDNVDAVNTHSLSLFCPPFEIGQQGRAD